ncbi:MAG: response regulator transcription factor [Lachnospiraceae bacterium]|nr:response regulator transcription factor [Lachnospiraceae bacterium]
MQKEISISICDDNPMAIKELREIVEAYLKKEDMGAKIESFDSGVNFLNSGREPDILFLDIEMPGEDGIQTGKSLRERGGDYRIIMATSMVERFKESFHIGASRFVTKPFEKEEVWEALENALQSFVGTGTITLYENRVCHQVQEKEIQYLQAYDSYTEAVVGKEERRMRTEQSLNRLEEELDNRLFCRISREFIINFVYVQSYDKGIVKIGEQRFSISRRRKKEFERAYREYDLYYRR